MEYSTLKDLFIMLNNEQIKNDFKTDEVKDIVKHYINSVWALKAYLADLRVDIKLRLREEMDSAVKLLKIREDVIKRIQKLKEDKNGYSSL